MILKNIIKFAPKNLQKPPKTALFINLTLTTMNQICLNCQHWKIEDGIYIDTEMWAYCKKWKEKTYETTSCNKFSNPNN